jgi:surface polysaccharide O-acyltransferase-like enzyme
MNSIDLKRSQHQIVGFNYLRVVACIAIIVLHATYACGYQFQNKISFFEYSATSAVTNCMMWAVPCFVMITGALLLDPSREVSIKKLYKKYLLRVFRALVVFVLIYRFFDMIISPEGITGRGILQGIEQIFTGTSWKPLWYLYMLIGLYLLLPIYRKIVQACSELELKYFLGIYFIFLSIFPVLSGFGININFTIHIASIYPFYLFMGYALRKQIICLNKKINLSIIIIGAVLITSLTFYRWDNNLAAMETLWSYSSPIVIIASCAVFCVFLNIQNKAPEVLHHILVACDHCSFGIYLIHIIFIKAFTQVLGFNPYIYGIAGFVGLIIIVFILAFTCTWLILKIVEQIKKSIIN